MKIKVEGQNCTLKIAEYVSNNIIFDKDELQRFKDLKMEFDESVSIPHIEAPANRSLNHFVEYYLPLSEFEGTVSSGKLLNTSEITLKWHFPFHLRYQLPNKNAPLNDFTEEIMEFQTRLPEFFYSCSNQVREDGINDFEEYLNNDVSSHKVQWTKLSYPTSIRDYHLSVKAPILSNREYLRINGQDIIKFETASVLVVLCSMAVITMTAMHKR